jgi:hypothetical protein
MCLQEWSVFVVAGVLVQIVHLENYLDFLNRLGRVVFFLKKIIKKTIHSKSFKGTNGQKGVSLWCCSIKNSKNDDKK